MADGQTMDDSDGVLPVRKRKAVARGVFTADGDSFVTRPVEALDLGLDGIAGDRHGGVTRASDVRTPWHPRGTTIFNDRQISIVSSEDLADIAAGLSVPAVEAAWLGANLLVAGIKQLSLLPRGTRLMFPSGATLLISDQNAPCRYAGAAVARNYPSETRLDFRFVEAARRRRGVVAYVERPGRVAEGDTIAVRIPEQWIWSH